MALCTIYNILSCLSITKDNLYNSEPFITPLPGTGITIGEIIDRIIHNQISNSAISIKIYPFNQTNNYPKEYTENALINFLYQIDISDIHSLQRSVQTYSSAYRYYEYNSSMINNPLIDSIIPNGGAIHQLAWKLSKMKDEGIVNISLNCTVSLLFFINLYFIILYIIF